MILAVSVLTASLLPLPAASAANLLTDPGFEDGLSGWTTTGNAAIRTADPLAHQGTNSLFGPSTPLFTASQTVGLSGAGVSDAQIDSGGFFASFGGWQFGWHDQTDHGTISIHFLDATGTEISSSSLSSFYSDNTWVEQSGTALVPVGTRSITYYFVGERDDGDNDDGYLDDADLEIVPEPSFFDGKVALSNGVYYLQLPSGAPFGYYSYLADPHYLYHFDLGYEYVFDANDTVGGVYLYDFASGDFFYTSPQFAFPDLYDFALDAVLYQTSFVIVLPLPRSQVQLGNEGSRSR